METAATAMTTAALLSTITEVFSAAVGWVGTAAEMAASNPLFPIGIVMGFIGIGTPLFSRLLRV